MNRQIRVLVGVIAVVFLLSLSAVGFAQEGRGMGRLQGVVYDKDKNVVPDVTLTLEYLQFSNKKTSVTEKDGSFAFLGLGKGLVKITAEKEGFLKQTVGPIDVSGASTNPKCYITLVKTSEIDPMGENGDEIRDIFTKATALFKEGKYEASLAMFEDFRKQQPEL